MSQVCPYRAYTGSSTIDKHNMRTYSFLEKDEVVTLINIHGDRLLIDFWDGEKYVPVNEEMYNNIIKQG